MKITFFLLGFSLFSVAAAPSIGLAATVAAFAVVIILRLAIADYSRVHAPLLVDLSDQETRRLRSPLRLAV